MFRFFLIKLAWRSLAKNKVRTSLTVLGIGIGIIAVVVVLSAGQSLKAYVTSQMDVFGSDLIQIEIKVPSAKKNSPNNTMGLATGISITTLTLEDAEAMRRLDNIKAVSPGLTAQELVSYGDQIKKTMIFGMGEDILEVNKLELAEGRAFSREENLGLAQVAVVGAKVKEKLFGDSSALGQDIKINRANYRVVGVLAKKGMASFMDMDDVIYLPVKTLQKKILGMDHVLFISASVADESRAPATAAEITDLLRQRHNISNPDKDDFSVTTMAEAQGMISTVFNGLAILLLALVAVSLLVGGVGIMNIMYVTVSERIYEIGLRKAVGAATRDIFWQFLFEAITLTVVAGFIGVIFGIILAFLISLAAQSQGLVFPFVISFPGIALGLAFSFAVGLVFGLTPARRAAALDPVTALRQE